jgi:hypothetical protein
MASKTNMSAGRSHVRASAGSNRIRRKRLAHGVRPGIVVICAETIRFAQGKCAVRANVADNNHHPARGAFWRFYLSLMSFRAHFPEVAQIRIQGVPVFGIERVVVNHIFQIVDCAIELIFIEMTLSEIAIEIGKMLLGVGIAVDLFAVLMLEMLGAPQVGLSSVYYRARIEALSQERNGAEGCQESRD